MFLFLTAADKLKVTESIVLLWCVNLFLNSSLLSMDFTDSGRLFHNIAALCQNDFLPISVLVRVRLIFRLSLRVLILSSFITSLFMTSGALS